MAFTLKVSAERGPGTEGGLHSDLGGSVCVNVDSVIVKKLNSGTLSSSQRALQVSQTALLVILVKLGFLWWTHELLNLVGVVFCHQVFGREAQDRVACAS